MASIDTGSVAGIINCFSIHHIDLDGLRAAMFEWNRVLVHKGHLLLAAWEGSGAIDYGGLFPMFYDLIKRDLNNKKSIGICYEFLLKN